MRLHAFDTPELVREIAFALLVKERRPITCDELAAASGVADLDSVLVGLAQAGWIDYNGGDVTGSAGLSLSDGAHFLRMRSTAFRTWCAYDAIGIPAALGEDADIETTCGVCAVPIAVSMVAGAPTRRGPAQLWLADGGGDLRTSFCTPTVLLCGPEHGAVWADRHGHAGRLVALSDAAAIGREAWAQCAAAADRVRALGENTEVEYVGGPRDSEHDLRSDTPPTIGDYMRSVRCADDGALRYVWQRGPNTAYSD